MEVRFVLLPSLEQLQTWYRTDHIPRIGDNIVIWKVSYCVVRVIWSQGGSPIACLLERAK